MKAAVTRSKAEKSRNSCTIKIAGATQGELRSLLNALGIYASLSPVARDVYYAVLRAANELGGFPEAAEGVVNPDDQEYVVLRTVDVPAPTPVVAPSPVTAKPKNLRCANCGGWNGHAITFNCKDSDFEEVNE